MSAAIDSVFRSMMLDVFKQALHEELPTLLKEVVPPSAQAKNEARPVQAELVLDVPQVAKRLNKNPATVRSWIHKGLLRATRPAGTSRYEIRERDIDAFLDGQQQAMNVTAPSEDAEAARALQKLYGKGKR